MENSLLAIFDKIHPVLYLSNFGANLKSTVRMLSTMPKPVGNPANNEALHSLFITLSLSLSLSLSLTGELNTEAIEAFPPLGPA